MLNIAFPGQFYPSLHFAFFLHQGYANPVLVAYVLKTHFFLAKIRFNFSCFSNIVQLSSRCVLFSCFMWKCVNPQVSSLCAIKACLHTHGAPRHSHLLSCDSAKQTHPFVSDARWSRTSLQIHRWAVTMAVTMLMGESLFQQFVFKFVKVYLFKYSMELSHSSFYALE